MPIILRETKGAPLTHNEMDKNILICLHYPLFVNELENISDVEPFLDFYISNLGNENHLVSGSNIVTFSDVNFALLKIPSDCVSFSLNSADVESYIFVDGFPLPHFSGCTIDTVENVTTFSILSPSLDLRFCFSSSSGLDLEIICNTVS